MIPLALTLALIWGAIWAAFLQLTPWGHYLAVRRTWITVVVGVGIDLLLMLLVVPLATWFLIVGIIAASAIGIIARSLYNEITDDRAAEDLNHAQ